MRRGCHLKYSIHGKELGSILLRHWIEKKYPDLASTQFRSHNVFKNFHSGEHNQKVADSYAGFTGYVWSGPKSPSVQCTVACLLGSCLLQVNLTSFLASGASFFKPRIYQASDE